MTSFWSHRFAPDTVKHFFPHHSDLFQMTESIFDICCDKILILSIFRIGVSSCGLLVLFPWAPPLQIQRNHLPTSRSPPETRCPMRHLPSWHHRDLHAILLSVHGGAYGGEKRREEVTSCLLQEQSGSWSYSVVTPFKECYLSLSKGLHRDNSFVGLDKTGMGTAGHRCLCLSLPGSSSHGGWPSWVSSEPSAQFLRCSKSQRLETNATHVTAERRRQTVGTLLLTGGSALVFYGAPADQKAWKRYYEVKWTTLNNLGTRKTKADGKMILKWKNTTKRNTEKIEIDHVSISLCFPA